MSIQKLNRWPTSSQLQVRCLFVYSISNFKLFFLIQMFLKSLYLLSKQLFIVYCRVFAVFSNVFTSTAALNAFWDTSVGARASNIYLTSTMLSRHLKKESAMQIKPSLYKTHFRAESYSQNKVIELFQYHSHIFVIFALFCWPFWRRTFS